MGIFVSNVLMKMKWEMMKMIDLNELASQAYTTAKKREKNGAFIS